MLIQHGHNRIDVHCGKSIEIHWRASLPVTRLVFLHKHPPEYTRQASNFQRGFRRKRQEIRASGPQTAEKSRLEVEKKGPEEYITKEFSAINTKNGGTRQF